MKAVLLILILTGCDTRNQLGRYKCNPEQWDQVKEQSDYCIEKLEIYASICLKSAKQTLCDYRHPFINEKADE